MNNEERFLAVIFGDPEIKCYPYVWQGKSGTDKVIEGEKTKEIWVGKTAYTVERVYLNQGIQEVLETLGEKPKRILNLRFGLEDGKCRTQREVGREYRVTGARIGQIIQRSLYRLRHPTKSRRLKAFLIPSPEERFKERQRVFSLEADLQRKKTDMDDLRKEMDFFGRKDEKRLDDALRKISADYQQKYRLSFSPYDRVHNILERQNLLRFSELKMLREEDIKRLKGIGKQTLEIIKKAL